MWTNETITAVKAIAARLSGEDRGLLERVAEYMSLDNTQHDPEQETIYEHTGGSKTFTVTAAEQWSKAMVRRLKAARPDEVDIRAENSDGSLVARFPKEWMRVIPPRRLSEEQRAIATERLKRVRPKAKSEGDLIS